MTANYTKGEWIKQGAFIFSSESPPRLIAEVIRSNMASPEQQANAHLIASAPDMYEALKECLDLLDKQREEYNNALTILPHQKVGEGEIAKRSRKVLAKAERKA